MTHFYIHSGIIRVSTAKSQWVNLSCVHIDTYWSLSIITCHHFACKCATTTTTTTKVISSQLYYVSSIMKYHAVSHSMSISCMWVMAATYNKRNYHHFVTLIRLHRTHYYELICDVWGCRRYVLFWDKRQRHSLLEFWLIGHEQKDRITHIITSFVLIYLVIVCDYYYSWWWPTTNKYDDDDVDDETDWLWQDEAISAIIVISPFYERCL